MSSASGDSGEADAGGRALLHHFFSKLKKLGRPAPGLGMHLGSPFHQAGSFHEATKILLVESQSLQSFDQSLQL